MQIPDPPFFLPPPLLNKHMRKDLKPPEERQLVLDYGYKTSKKDPMEGVEIDAWLVFFTIKFLAGWFKVDKTTIQCIWNCPLECYYIMVILTCLHKFPAISVLAVPSNTIMKK